MAIKKSEISTLSNRYAKALLGAASQAGALEQVSKDLQAVAAIITGDQQFHRMLASGAVVRGKLKELFADIAKKAGLSDVTKNFLFALVENNRSSIIPEIHKKKNPGFLPGVSNS